MSVIGVGIGELRFLWGFVVQPQLCDINLCPPLSLWLDLAWVPHTGRMVCSKKPKCHSIVKTACPQCSGGHFRAPWPQRLGFSVLRTYQYQSSHNPACVCPRKTSQPDISVQLSLSKMVILSGKQCRVERPELFPLEGDCFQNKSTKFQSDCWVLRTRLCLKLLSGQWARVLNSLSTKSHI